MTMKKPTVEELKQAHQLFIGRTGALSVEQYAVESTLRWVLYGGEPEVFTRVVTEVSNDS